MTHHSISLSRYNAQPPEGEQAWGWFMFFMGPYKWAYGFFAFLNLLRQTFFRMQPLFFGLLVGWIESGAIHENPQLFLIWMGGYVCLALTAYYSLLYILPQSERIMDAISKHLSLFAFRHYLNLSESWHENRASGEKLQRLLKARDGVFLLLIDIFWEAVQFPAIALAVFLSVLMLNADWYYIALFYGMVTSYICMSYITGNWLKTPLKNFYKTQEDVVGGVYEFLTSTSTVRFFNLKRYVMDKAVALETINHDVRKKLFKIIAWRWALLNTTMLIWVLVIIAWATYDVLYRDLSIAAYTAILFLNLTVWAEIEIFARLYATMLDHWEGFKRLTDVLSQKPSISDKDDAAALQTEKPHIRFDNVSFEYQEQASIINELSLDIKPGEKVGLMGASGAGKSTIIKLIMRFYDINSGAIHIDEHDIRDVTRHSLQHHIAVIPQDAVLFNHSLMENIRYGRLEASDEEVINAAKRAYAYDFIQGLPGGFETMVGERGVKLSGGQRQRIAIARAILKDAPILILDEATSALDSESEQILQRSLAELMKGKTVIAIAHRLSTINTLDRLIVMDQGRIVEDGTHDALLARGGLYNKLWTMQSGGFLKT